MVGTPVKVATCSRSISSRARPGSHLCISTSLAPRNVSGCSTQLLAVTWNSGVGTIADGGTSFGGSISTAPDSATAAAAAPAAALANAMCIRLCTEPRWVSWAPFGKPVVPEV